MPQTTPATVTNPTTASSPQSPAALIERFGPLLAAGDLDGLAALYTDDALFVPAPGVVHRGRAAIRGALAELAALSPRMQSRILEVHESGDTALVIVDWSLTGTAPDGSVVEQGGRSADVLHRQPDGSWRVLIDHP